MEQHKIADPLFLSWCLYLLLGPRSHIVESVVCDRSPFKETMRMKFQDAADHVGGTTIIDAAWVVRCGSGSWAKQVAGVGRWQGCSNGWCGRVRCIMRYASWIRWGEGFRWRTRPFHLCGTYVLEGSSNNFAWCSIGWLFGWLCGLGTRDASTGRPTVERQLGPLWPWYTLEVEEGPVGAGVACKDRVLAPDKGVWLIRSHSYWWEQTLPLVFLDPR